MSNANVQDVGDSNKLPVNVLLAPGFWGFPAEAARSKGNARNPLFHQISPRLGGDFIPMEIISERVKIGENVVMTVAIIANPKAVPPEPFACPRDNYDHACFAPLADVHHQLLFEDVKRLLKIVC